MTTEHIIEGVHDGLLGDVVSLHARYYARNWGFPVQFECKVASEIAAFLLRYDPARDLVLALKPADRVLGSITIDGSDPALDKGQAHLRWFILDGALWGHGMGRRLAGAAIGFARQAGFATVYLTTFRGLDAAASLYARLGFDVVAEQEGQSWGRTVVEQRLELRL